MKSQLFVSMVAASVLLAGTSVYAASSKASTASVAPVTAAVAQTTAPVNLNKADLAALESIKGLGTTKAQAIIDYRSKNGNFKTVEDLQNVPGIGPKLLGKIQSYVTVG